ncbi:hypothetical protein GCM10027406_32170 [Leifsonia lichenia]
MNDSAETPTGAAPAGENEAHAANAGDVPPQPAPAPYPALPVGAAPVGAAPVGAAPVGAAAVSAAQVGVSAKSKKVLVWIIAAAAAFLVLAIGAIVTVVLLVNAAGGTGGAKDVAQQYLAAIAKGDAKAANALGRVDTADENNVLLSNAVLSKATRISAPNVKRFVEGASSELTRVEVAYKLDGKGFTGWLEVERDEDGWFVAQGLEYQVPTLPYDVDAFRIAGVNSALDASDRGRVAYPGVYTLLPPNEFFELSGDTKMLVSRDYRPIKKLELVPSEKYVAAVQKELNAQIDACAAKTVFSEIEDCGLNLGFPITVRSSEAAVVVTVAEYPVVSAADTSDYYEFSVDGGAMSAVASGPDYRGNPATEDITAELTSYGMKVGLEGGKVVVTLR